MDSYRTVHTHECLGKCYEGQAQKIGDNSEIFHLGPTLLPLKLLLFLLIVGLCYIVNSQLIFP